MDTPKITTVEELRKYLHIAMKVEHATIPPYLLALYSIHPGSNYDATQVLRVIVVEEMLHLTLAANLLNAIGGKPNLTAAGFVHTYPTGLPDGEDDFEVPLQPFSKDAIDIFLKIERPAEAPSESARFVARKTNQNALNKSPLGPDLHYFSIGEFYEEIRRGFDYLHALYGDEMFSGAPAKQVTAEYFYSGGGKLFPVTDLCSAQKAINLIIEQGEGFGGGIYNDETELAHFYRFEELKFEQHYQKGDKPHSPTGPVFRVEWDKVYNFKKNAKLCDYPAGSELHMAAIAFNEGYSLFLALLTDAFNGMPELLMKAVPQMFSLRNSILRLIHNPIPGCDGLNAAPTFEMTPEEAVKPV
jgi:hypothetical protein